ncbi:MAG: hypothetical protein NTX88_05290 [Candidatus Atribacteria bacterium]|nr:hypothetical protein [Candidatus Atribacteria bacterium]
MSGFNAIQIASRICKTRSKREIPLLSNFHLTLCDVYDPTTLCPIDEALVVIMRGPGSYTCEDVVEIQVHGGPLLLQHILRFCIDLGARYAEPGEFTKRAFLNGRIDLSQAARNVISSSSFGMESWW